ncbi:MAG TPA: isoprenoid biosynthesis glyoxalase ElbB [Abditibacteriaceae bacterium]|jgi:enhancing lycopene biosynthesis protein 2
MKVGLVLSGCGVEDGSEIYEAVLTVLALEKGGAHVMAIAPDIEQAHVVNHYTGEESRGETRDVLAESARIMRGKVVAASEVSSHEIDALILVGGYGTVKNLSGWVADGENAIVNADISRLITEMNGLGKPVGAMCAAAYVVALALREKSPTLTVGTDGSATLGLSRIGVSHALTEVDEICIDTHNKIVSTAAFLSAQSVSEAETGITKLVNEVLRMARENGPGHDATTTTYTRLDAGLNTPNA